jgi:hypothetical protein
MTYKYHDLSRISLDELCCNPHPNIVFYLESYVNQMKETQNVRVVVFEVQKLVGIDIHGPVVSFILGVAICVEDDLDIYSTMTLSLNKGDERKPLAVCRMGVIDR